MRHIKSYNFGMKHFFFKCVFFEILRGFHTFGKLCIPILYTISFAKPFAESLVGARRNTATR